VEVKRPTDVDLLGDVDSSIYIIEGMSKQELNGT
jgi:hypothetical protein